MTVPGRPTNPGRKNRAPRCLPGVPFDLKVCVEAGRTLRGCRMFSPPPLLGEVPGTDRRVLPCAGVPTQHRWAGAGDPRFWSPQNDLGVKPPRWPGELPRPNPTADPAGVGEGSSCCVASVRLDIGRPKIEVRPRIDGNPAPPVVTSGFQAFQAPPRSRYPAEFLATPLSHPLQDPRSRPDPDLSGSECRRPSTPSNGR
jgi:hypothetical protein